MSDTASETSERQIEQQFVQYAERRGCLSMKLRAENLVGFPDRTVLTPFGDVLFIEFKKPGGRLRPGQRIWARRLECLGQNLLITNSLREALDFLDSFLPSDA